LLVHRYNYKNGEGVAPTDNLVSGHAFSETGAEWHFSSVPPFDSQLENSDGPPTPFTSLERPHLIMDDVTKEPTHLVVAASPAYSSTLCGGCRGDGRLRRLGLNSSCVLCKLTAGIDATYTIVVPLGPQVAGT
jgi:hypothetical protein